jgi:hypothetical protein
MFLGGLTPENRDYYIKNPHKLDGLKNLSKMINKKQRRLNEIRSYFLAPWQL